MNSNLDVWTIQNNPDMLEVALNRIDNGLTIVYDNCYCAFQVGSKIIKNCVFPTIIYNEECDILIMLKSSDKEKAINYLVEEGLKFVEINFENYETKEDSIEDISDIWIARQASVLDDALKDSKEKGLEEITYYPNVVGSMQIDYKNTDLCPVKIDGREFQGFVVLADKIIMIVNNGSDEYKGPLDLETIMAIANRNDMFVKINPDKEIEFPLKSVRYR